jgi:cephalosporin hydroxylase
MTLRIGTFFRERDQPPISCEDAETVRRFHDLYYRRWSEGSADTLSLSWFGYEVVKCPLDLWIYQELLVRTRPDVVIETGTWCGGSALYIAMLLDHMGHGRVITIDVETRSDRPEHPRISYVTGSSTDPNIIAHVHSSVGSERTMVILDADHHAPIVYDEILAYASATISSSKTPM